LRAVAFAVRGLVQVLSALAGGKGSGRLSRLFENALPARMPHARAFGCYFDLDLSDHVDRSIFWETYEPSTLALWRSGIHPLDNVIDVGANAGLFAVLAAKGGARTYAFEPNPEVLEKLRANVLLNDLGDLITVVPLALSDQASRRQLFFDAHESEKLRNSGVASLARENAGSRSVMIDAVTLDEFVEDNRLHDISWIKIDVQGSEMAVLRGASETLRRHRPRILFEYDPENAKNMNWDWSDIVKFMDDHGYAIQFVESQNHLATPVTIIDEPRS